MEFELAPMTVQYFYALYDFLGHNINKPIHINYFFSSVTICLQIQIYILRLA